MMNPMTRVSVTEERLKQIFFETALFLGKDALKHRLMRQGLSNEEARQEIDIFSTAIQERLDEYAADPKMDEVLRLLYVKFGGAALARPVLILRLADWMPSGKAEAIVNAFLVGIELDGTKKNLDRLVLRRLKDVVAARLLEDARKRHQKIWQQVQPIIRQAEMKRQQRTMPKTAPTKTIKCPKCQNPLVIRPGQTKVVRCKKKKGKKVTGPNGCGYEYQVSPTGKLIIKEES